jgi:hypothetical protein
MSWSTGSTRGGFLSDDEAAELRLLADPVKTEQGRMRGCARDEVAWEAHWMAIEAGGRAHPYADALGRYFARLFELITPKFSETRAALADAPADADPHSA